MDRRQFFGALSAIGATSLAGCGDDTSSQSATDSTSTPPQRGQTWTGPVAIGRNDDAQSIIESTGPRSWFVIEPGSTHRIVPPLHIPKKTVLDGGFDARSPSDTTFEKAGDGPMATVGQQTVIRGIHFDGKREDGRRGDGLVDRHWNQPQIRLVGVTIRRMAGDARVHNTPHRWLYQDVRLINNGRYGIRNITTDHDGPRRGHYLGGAIAKNHMGGIISDGTHERDNFYYTSFRANGGPAYTFDSGGRPSNNVRLYGNIRLNDGPAVYIKSGALQGWDLGLTIGQNNHDLDAAGLGGMGRIGNAIHSESSDGSSQVTFSSGIWRTGNGSDALVTAGGAPLQLSIAGGSATGGTIEGRVALSMLDATSFDVDWSGAQAGIALDPFEGVIHRSEK